MCCSEAFASLKLAVTMKQRLATSVLTQQKCHKEERVASRTLTSAALATFSHVGHACT